MPLKPKKNSLADKINSLITAAPTTFGSDDETEDTKAKVVEQYDEDSDSDGNVKPSKIRRLNIDTLDQIDNRYAGRKVSRRDVHKGSDSEDSDNESAVPQDSDEDKEEEMNEESEDGDSDNENEDSEKEDVPTDDQHDDNEEQGSDEQTANSDEEADGSSEDDDEEDYGFDIGNPLLRNRQGTSKIKTMSDTNIKADVEKGNCVRNQLKLWESMLEMRIKLQKCVVTSNQMPQHNVHKNYRTDIDFMKKTNEAKDKLALLLNNLLQLQGSLLKQYPETRNLNSKKEKGKDSGDGSESVEDDLMDEEIPSDTEDEAENEVNSEEEKDEEAENKQKDKTQQKKLRLSEYEKKLQENHKIYMGYRDSVIQKWNEKTRIATGKLNKGMGQTTLKQIEFALTDKPKLRKKTQLKRSEYGIVGKAETPEDEDGRRVQEYDSEIYDDDDFYHQLLRDLIEYKSSDVTDPIQLSKQWIQLQNMRRKMKRKIDTKATKGRRIRYNVHNKLVNFMAPITVNDTWTDHAKNELYNSLFGKIKPVEETVHN